jgi:hypothetical protein
VRSLETRGAASDLAQAYLYLGVAYLELDQEALARGKFAQALVRAPEMRLDPSEFSPQVIRIFETTRQEALATRANDQKVAPPSTTGAATEGERRGRSAVPWLILGGAAVAGGVALAAGGSAATAPSPTPSSTPTPEPSASPTPGPTEPPPPAPCTFSASPSSRAFNKDGGPGTCQIDASRAGCTWNVVSTRPWVRITSGTTGRGDGIVRYLVLENDTNSPRLADVHLVEEPRAKCEIRQSDSGGNSRDDRSSHLAWSTDLQVAGATGRVVVDRGSAMLLGSGRSAGSGALPRGPHRFEAVLASGGREPGVWRFRFQGMLRPGSLRVRAGEAASVSSDTIVFRLRGTPGERIAFDLEAGP